MTKHRDENFELSSGEEINILMEINIKVPPSKEFIDTQFPPKSTSISKKDSEIDKWLPTSEISKNPKLFINGTDEADVRQGAIGDCWFDFQKLTFKKKGSSEHFQY
jgi:hypothetical protein